MDAFSDNLARNIIKEVLEDYRESRSGPNGSSLGGRRSGSPANAHHSSRSQSSNQSPLTAVRNGQNKCIRKRKTAKEEAEINSLADRLTTDIISHATSSGKYSKRFSFSLFGFYKS